MKEKLIKIFDEILDGEIYQFSFQEETLIPKDEELIKTLKISYKTKKEKKDERKITEKQFNLLKKILEKENNKNLLKDKFQINPEEIENISLKMASEIIDFFIEDENGKK